MISRAFDLLGIVLRLESEDASLVENFAMLLEGLELKNREGPAFVVTIETGTPESIPAAAATIYAGPMAWEGNCVYASSHGRLHLLFPDRISLTIDPAGKVGRIVVSPDGAEHLVAATGMLLLDVVIDASGQFLLHAAGLTLPDSDAQIVLFAPSGTGKTTASLALAASGFGLCTDDAMVVRAQRSSVTGWGLPRDLKVHRKTSEMMPWLQPYLGGEWDIDGEQPVRRVPLTSTVRIEACRHRPIAGVFLLERGDGTETSVVPLGETETLTALALDNIKSGRTGLLDLQRRRFTGLATLASRVKGFKATVGSDLRMLAPAIVETTGQKMRRNTA